MFCINRIRISVLSQGELQLHVLLIEVDALAIRTVEGGADCPDTILQTTMRSTFTEHEHTSLPGGRGDLKSCPLK